MVCQVCQSSDEGFHFGALTCRCCAAFWRRSIVRNLEYECKARNECEITRELRKTCPACRMARCRAIGMTSKSIQWHRDANGPLRKSQRLDTVVGEDATSDGRSACSSSSATPSSLANESANGWRTAIPPSTQPSLLDRLHEGVRDYMQGEKFLYFMLYPESGVDADDRDLKNFRDIDHDELIRTERACLPLVQRMVSEWFPAYETLPISSKTEVMRNFSNSFSSLHKPYLNTLIENVSGRMVYVMHYRQYISLNGPFYEKHADPEYSWKLDADLISFSYKYSCRMQNARVREIELAALCGIALANEVGVVFKTDLLADFRSQIHEQLYADILRNYPADEAPTRFSELLSFLKCADMLTNYVEESITMRKLLNAHILEVFQD